MHLRDIALLNLRRRKAKAAFVLTGLVVGVATLVALVSLVTALTHEVNHKLEQYGANILITPQSDALSLSYGGMNLGGFSFDTKEIPQKHLADIAHIKNAANVAAVGPVVLGAVEVGGRKVLLAGVDFATAPILKPWWKVSGQIPREPSAQQAVVGAEAARILGLQAGSRINLGGRDLGVAGTLEPTGSSDDNLIFAPLPVAQGILGKEGLISMAEVAALCKDCPVDDMVMQISKIIPGAKVMAIQSVVKGRMEFLSHFRDFGLGVSGLVALVGGLVVLTTMLGSVKERTREIGIFRAIGFRKGHVVRVVLWEAAVISLAAGVLGWLAGLGIGQAALPWFAAGGDAAVHLDPMVAAAGLGMALVLGIGASIYPALTAARMDPADALRTL